MGLEIRDLRLVEAIAAQGTMTRAANRLNITQSALSHQLTSLEAGLGVALFDRLPRGMRITTAGETLLANARQVLVQLQRAEEEVRCAGAAGRGLLRISTECYTCYHWLPARIKDFQERFPGVEVRIAAEATRHPIPALLAGELEIAVTSYRPRERSLLVRPLFDDELVAILAPSHRLADRAWLNAADFAAEHLITYSVPLENLTLYQEFLKPAGVKPGRISRVDLTEAMIEMVKAGLGIAVLARWAVERHLNPATLKAVALRRGGFARTWYAATVKSKTRPRYLDAFVDLLAGPNWGV
jgi:LysR family transcriptional regulator for metE and metH